MLGRAVAFSFKKYVVGAIGIAILFGAYKAYSDVSDWFEGVKQDRINLETTKANNDKLKQEIDTEKSNSKMLSDALDLERKRFEDYQVVQVALANLQKKEQKEQDERKDAINKEMANLPCSIEPIPDNVIRMHKQQWEEGRARNQVR